MSITKLGHSSWLAGSLPLTVKRRDLPLYSYNMCQYFRQHSQDRQGQHKHLVLIARLNVCRMINHSRLPKIRCWQDGHASWQATMIAFAGCNTLHFAYCLSSASLLVAGFTSISRLAVIHALAHWSLVVHTHHSMVHHAIAHHAWAHPIHFHLLNLG